MSVEGKTSESGHKRRLTLPAATSVITLNADTCLRCNICRDEPIATQALLRRVGAHSAGYSN